jgi:predicted DNA-binding transcriptional regulator AlpA
MNTDELLDTKQTAAWLGVAPITLEVWRVKRRGPDYIVLGTRSIRYRRSAVQAWLDAQTRQLHTSPIAVA